MYDPDVMTAQDDWLDTFHFFHITFFKTYCKCSIVVLRAAGGESVECDGTPVTGLVSLSTLG